LKNDPALKEILAENVTPLSHYVYRVNGRLDAAGCGRARC
jgi:hypothetical protein